MNTPIKELEMGMGLPLALADVIEDSNVTSEEAAGALLSVLAFTMEDAKLNEGIVIYGNNSYKQLRVVVTKLQQGVNLSALTGVRLQ